MPLPKDLRLLELYERELKAVAGVDEALEALGPHTSASPPIRPAERVETALRIAGLTRLFGNRITTFEHVARGKPEPDVFIEAARRAGYASARLHRDGGLATGVTAAHRAGCQVLGFTGTHPHPENRPETARCRARSMAVPGSGPFPAGPEKYFDIALQHVHMGLSRLADPGIREAHVACSRSGHEATSRTYLSRG